MIELQKLIDEIKDRKKSHEEVMQTCTLHDTYRSYEVKRDECDFFIQKLELLLKKTREQQP
jgi:hypothetical protein